MLNIRGAFMSRLSSYHGYARVVGGSVLVILSIGADARAQTSTVQAAHAAVAVAASTGPGSEQSASVAAAALQQAVRRVLIEAAVADPTTSSNQGASQHQLTVVADKGDVSGRARFYLPIGPNADGQITLTTPLSSGKGTFATLNGIGKNVSVSASLKFSVWSKTLLSTTNEAAAQVASLARTVAGGPTPLSPTRQFLADLENIRRAAAIAGENRTIAAAATVSSGAAGDQRLARLVAAPSITSTPERFYAAVVQQLPELVSTRWAAYLTPGLETTRHSVDYLETETAASNTFEKAASVVTFAGGVSRMAEWRKSGEGDKLLTPLFYAGISFRGGNSVSVPDEKNICRPFGSSGASECLDSPVGMPSQSNIKSITVEYRHWAYDQSLGLNPRFTYSVEESEPAATRKTLKSFEVPIYFMHQVKDINVRDITFGADLTGGVSIGWRDDGSKSGAFATIFLTKVFGLP
jgi:hypothetical protein